MNTEIFNSHVHTNNSEDGKASAEEMCLAACRAGLSGITVTDHCNIATFISDNSYSRIKKSVSDAERMKEKYADNLFVGTGAEIGEAIWNPGYTARILQLADFDAILASVHRVRHESIKGSFSCVDFSVLTDKQINEYMDRYFDDVYETALSCDFDILSHLTIPLRYITGIYGRHVCLDGFAEKTDKILQSLIERGKALELNTSEIGDIGFMPDAEILRRYRCLGGELVSVGADSHVTEKISYGIDEGLRCLKECGFDYYVYYRQRTAIKVFI